MKASPIGDETLTRRDVGAKDRWTYRDAAHLLRRAQFGASHDEIERAVADGLDATLDRLLSPRPESPEFVSVEPLLRQTAYDTANINDLKAWWVYRMLYSANSLTEKMVLFWHNHFATSNAKVRSVPHMAAQNDLIRKNAVGSFRTLLHGMTRDVAMLVWLDGNGNRKRQPNENFARELMELFSLGVGNYTEVDIKQAARCFTGWHVRNDQFWYDRSQHDFGSKTVLGRSGDLDGGDVVDVCLTQRACPKFLAVKLLHFFVSPAPTPTLIEQLAGRIRAHDFAMNRVLRELLASQAFYAPAARHAIIKSPLDLVLGAHRALRSQADLPATVRILSELGQDVFEPPTVKGWDGGRLWVNSGLVLKRTNFAAELATGGSFGTIGDPADTADEMKLETSQSCVQHYLQLLLSREVEALALERLTRYSAEASGDRSQRLRGLIYLIMAMPEFQLS